MAPKTRPKLLDEVKDIKDEITPTKQTGGILEFKKVVQPQVQPQVQPEAFQFDNLIHTSVVQENTSTPSWKGEGKTSFGQSFGNTSTFGFGNTGFGNTTTSTAVDSLSNPVIDPPSG
jgi:hypothetical protein